MCGRFTLTSPASKLVEIFGLLDPKIQLEPRYNIAPTQLVACIRQSDGFRSLELLRWGLLPVWARHISEGAKMINARSESVATKPAFKSAFASRRCLIPADGFFEWKRKGTEKQPYLIRMRSAEPFAMAGLWECWRDPEAGSDVESCTVLTTAPNPLVADIHDRMPVILDEQAQLAWLNANTSTDQLELKLQSYSADLMEAVPVHRSVGNVRNDSPLCITPIQTQTQQELF
jgi:putative SOS response-associated peptidase YedK